VPLNKELLVLVYFMLHCWVENYASKTEPSGTKGYLFNMEVRRCWVHVFSRYPEMDEDSRKF